MIKRQKGYLTLYNKIEFYLNSKKPISMVTVTDIKRIVRHYEAEYTKWADENDANTFDELLAEACKAVNKNGGTQEDVVASIEEVMRKIKMENNTV